jgi:probable F420-dependent oxidoreductase
VYGTAGHGLSRVPTVGDVIDLGRFGVATGLDSSPASLDAARAVEDLGYSTLWLTGGPLPGLATVADIVRATERLTVATAVLSVDAYAADDVTSLYDELQAERPDRFIVGLGGAHGPKPIATMESYLDRLDGVPREVRVLAALGPRMLRMARDRAAGAVPIMITPEYTAEARSLLGDGPVLAVEQLVVLESDPARAREIAADPISFLRKLPGYAASFRRMGFTDDEIDQLAPRLLDSLVAWGDVDTIAARLDEYRTAGADHIALNVLTGITGPQPIDEWRVLAGALLES